MLRAFTFGSPTIQIDEQFYLLVGDRMLHGALPFVDIWDRKPMGLFLLFAAIRLLGGEGIVQYQLVALLSVVATSVVIWRTARMIASRWAPCARRGLSAVPLGLLLLRRAIAGLLQPAGRAGRPVDGRSDGRRRPPRALFLHGWA
jgi:hypothetical protein